MRRPIVLALAMAFLTAACTSSTVEPADDSTGANSPAEASGQIGSSAGTNGHTDPEPIRGDLVNKRGNAFPGGRAGVWTVQLENSPPPRARDEGYIARIPHDVQPECASTGQPTGLDEADVPIPVALWPDDVVLRSNPPQHPVTRIVVENC